MVTSAIGVMETLLYRESAQKVCGCFSLLMSTLALNLSYPVFF